MKRVTLFTKPGCHLCEVVERTIAEVGRSRAFELEIRNILDDEGDYREYQHDVPVVMVNGKEIARHRMERRKLEAVLDRAVAQ